MENWEKIRNELLSTGGLLITNRQCGKTLALMHILRENKNAVLLTFNSRMVENIINKYIRRFDLKIVNEVKDIKARVFSSSMTQIPKIKNPKENLYIDEYFFHKVLYKDFAGAVSSMSFPVRIMKFNTFETDVSRETMRGVLGEDSWEKEYGLYLPTTDEYLVQIMGEYCTKLNIDSNQSREEIERTILYNNFVMKEVGDREVKKIVIVPRKLISIITAEK